MSDTPTSRGYAWAKQTDYATVKAIGAGNYKQIIVTDQNFLDYEAQTQNDEDWAHGVNSLTDEWIEAHSCRVQHTMPLFAQQIGELFYINLGQYAVTTPGGGTTSKNHNFKPTDPNTTRQDKAVSYVEKAGAGWNILAPSMVGDGFTLKGDGVGVMMADFGLVGSGKVDFGSTATWFPTSTPTVTRRTGQHKLFNTQVALITDDGVDTTAYECRYRSFEIAYKKTMLDEASMSPGCANFLTDGDQTTGLIRSSHEFDKQTLDFTFEVDMAVGSPEAAYVQSQAPLSIALTATGGIIEGSIHHAMNIAIPVGKYTTTKPVVSGGIMRFSISGKALFDFATSKLFSIDLVNDIATYASAF